MLFHLFLMFGSKWMWNVLPVNLDNSTGSQTLWAEHAITPAPKKQVILAANRLKLLSITLRTQLAHSFL
jgi:hypothetical protein